MERERERDGGRRERGRGETPDLGQRGGMDGSQGPERERAFSEIERDGGQARA